MLWRSVSVLESKRRALHVVKAGVYVRAGHIRIVDRAHLAVLAVPPPVFVWMHYERASCVSC